MALTKNKAIIGIIGGMGPMATCDLFNKVIRFTKAENDQDHVHMIIDNNTDIPDRSAHILGQGITPVPEMKKAIAKLIFDGADVLAMPCNTAHYYYDELYTFAQTLNEQIEFVHMIEETASYCYKREEKKVLLLATKGTYVSNIYRKPFEDLKVELIYPPEHYRELVMAAIYAYKTGAPINPDVFEKLQPIISSEEITAVILGCTELPLIFQTPINGCHTVDPTAILAQTLSQLK